MINFIKFTEKVLIFVLASVYLFVSILALSSTTKAQSRDDGCTEQLLRARGMIVVTCSGERLCPTNNSSSFSPVGGQENLFIMGDSITVGMVNFGGLMTRLGPAPNGVGLVNDPSYVIVPNSSPDTYRGPSIEATGGWDIEQMQRTLSLHQSDLQSATAIVIALGTNAGTSGLSTYQRRLVDFISDVRQYNSAARIIWLNTYFNSPGSPNHELINPVIASAINEVSQSDPSVRIQIIDVESAIENGELLAPNADSVHYTGQGYEDRAQWLVGELNETLRAQPSSPSNETGIPPGCTCPTAATAVNLSLSENERYTTTWSFFVDHQGLSPEATAGIMGNLQAESGIDPHNMQNNAPLPDGPSMPVREGPDGQMYPAREIEGRFGYGLAQWTSAGRQKNLIDFAAAQGRSTGDLTLQLEFLWQELSTSYTSVLSVLQTPGVSVQEASDEFLLRFEIPASVILPPRGDSTPERRAETMRERGEMSTAIYNRLNGTGGGYTPTASCSQRTDDSYGLVDLTSDDQTSAQCASGTTDEGVVDAYNDGRPARIRLCNVLGQARVNAQVSGQVLAMLNDADETGVALGVSDSFRPLDGPFGQIATYERWCEERGIRPSPGPFPYPTWNGATRCPGAAAPGYSNHGMGVALDFTCNGQLIPQSFSSAQNNQCFQWLLANASNYGFREYGNGQRRDDDGYEAWHWSVDGG